MKAGTTSGAMVVLVVVLVARRAHNPKVAGSNPAPATNLGVCPSLEPVLRGRLSCSLSQL